jgi:hypothetical protein
MNICIVYIYPVAIHGAQHATYAERFVKSYRQHPPGLEHSTVVISNGGGPSSLAVRQCSWLQNAKFLQHDDSGMDIGGYQLAARTAPCDMMVCLGGASYFRGPNWLKRMVEVFEAYGEGLYGCTGNQGDNRVTANGIERVWPHIRTTGFWCSPKLINSHPFKVFNNSQRYPYEHGQNSLTNWAIINEKPVLVVGWNEIRQLHNCDSMPGGFHNGTQHNLIVGDRLTEPSYHNVP